MCLILLVNLASAVLIFVGIWFSLPNKKRKWQLILMTFLLLLTACVINTYHAHQDEQHKHDLMKRMEMIDRELINSTDYIKNILETCDKPPAPKSPKKIKGNVAGIIRAIDGTEIGGVLILNAQNNPLGTSHNNGEFVVSSISENDILKFSARGYNQSTHLIKKGGFSNILQIVLSDQPRTLKILGENRFGNIGGFAILLDGEIKHKGKLNTSKPLTINKRSRLLIKHVSDSGRKTVYTNNELYTFENDTLLLAQNDFN